MQRHLITASHDPRLAEIFERGVIKQSQVALYSALQRGEQAKIDRTFACVYSPLNQNAQMVTKVKRSNKNSHCDNRKTLF